MSSFDFPFDLTVSHYNATIDPTTKIATLPKANGTTTLNCDVQLRNPGAVFEQFGIECTKPALVLAPQSETGKMKVGSTFVYEGETYIFRTEPSTKADGGPLDYLKAIASVLHYG